MLMQTSDGGNKLDFNERRTNKFWYFLRYKNSPKFCKKCPFEKIPAIITHTKKVAYLSRLFCATLI